MHSVSKQGKTRSDAPEKVTMLKWGKRVKERRKMRCLSSIYRFFHYMFDIFNDTGARETESIISTAYHAVLTLIVFQLLLCLSSPNFPSSFPALFLT